MRQSHKNEHKSEHVNMHNIRCPKGGVSARSEGGGKSLESNSP